MRKLLNSTAAKPPRFRKTTRFVNLTWLLMLIFNYSLSAADRLQDKISLDVKSADLKKVLSEIQKQTAYRFLYNQSLVQNKKVDVHVTDAEVPDVLNQIFDGKGIGYRIMDHKLVVLKSTSDGQAINIADIRVSGRVTGNTGEPLPGVSVTAKGTTIGTQTDANGVYNLTVPDATTTLIFSYVGFQSQEVAINGRSNINVSLTATQGALNEVVVIGYGTAQKRDLTGSIVKIAGKEVADRPNTNPVASLQGKVAGVSIVNSGQPGQEPDIRIRGTISRYQTKPLYVVDGILNDNINFLNPNDIESIEILKDPSSLAIFGVRGANGVIIVSTKKARAGQTLVSFSSTFGVKNIVGKPELTDAEGFKTLYNEQRANQGDVPYPDYGLFRGNTDWIDLIAKKNAIVTNNNISIASGTEKNRFYMGLGYIQEEGLIRYERLQKLTLTINNELQVFKPLKVGVNISGYRSYLPQLKNFNSALIATPIVEPFNAERGVYNKLPELIGGPQIGNPLLGVEGNSRTFIGREHRFVGSLYAEINFLKYFTLRGNLLGDFGFNDSRNYTPIINVYAAEINQVAPQSGFINTSVSQNSNNVFKFQQDYLLTFKKNFGDHGVTALGGFTTYYEGLSSQTGSVSQYTNRDPIPNDRRWWYLNVFPYGDPSTRVATSNQWERTTASTLFRLLYNYKGKYLLNGSFRRDGSSEISPSARYDNFWALGGAWELSRESFMDNQKLFSNVKVKASVGKLGNQYTGINYPYYPNLAPGQTAVFGNTILPAYVLAYRNDDRLRWETVTSKEGGVEFSMFQNKLRAEVNYFHKVTNDLLVFVNAGSEQFYINSGKIQNKGIEASATWSGATKSGFGYSIGGNITTLNNKVLEVYTPGFTIIEGSSRTIADYPIGHFFGYVHDGIYQSVADKLGSPNAGALGLYGPGDIKYKDINNDGKIDVNDRTIIGNPTPDFIYGFSLSGNYKGFDVSVDLQGVYGNEVWRNWGNGNSFAQFNYRAARLGRWNGPGTSNWEPQVNDLVSINRENSTYMIEDGSYFRIRNVQIGYNFAPGFLSKAHIRSLRLFFNGQNLQTWKRNSGFTPEAGGSAISFGVDNGGYPIPAITSLGLNLTF